MTVIPPLSLVSPAVWRSPDVLEVPLASGPCLLTGVPTQMKRAVTLLDGYHATDELEELVGPVWARWLVDTLKTRDGFVSTQRPQPLRVDVTGSGLLAHKLKRGLASDDTATSRLVVVACPTWEADRVLTDSLIASRTAHVVVTVTDTLASVGPFWVPGRGSCLRCMDLARRAHDPSWPLAVFQLMQVKARPDTVLASWALATVAAHVRGFSSGHEPESMSSTITMDRSGALTYRAWPLHPACHCSGSADAGRRAPSPCPMSSTEAAST